MIELDLYFYVWLGNLLRPIENLSLRWPRPSLLDALIKVRIPLASFATNPDRGRAFPGTARVAGEIVSAINAIIPPVVEGETISQDWLPEISESRVDQIKALCNGFAVALRQEAEHAYILKVEDQRCFSSYTLVEQIENCFSKEVWGTVKDDTKRELEESGKCLALERFTGAGFHALRGVECVIRQYFEKLTGQKPPTDRKRDWGFYIKTLKEHGAPDDLTSVLDNN